MSIEQGVLGILNNVLQVELSPDAVLLGVIPEFDSMAVVSILTAIEEKYDFFVDDDEIDADIFETVGTLVAFVKQKL